MMQDDNQGMMDKMCGCGSGKKFGECHYNQPCWCGSGKMAQDCCAASPETHGMSSEEK